MSLYETDFVEWSERTAKLLREGRFEDIDLANVAEEIESLGRSDRRQLRNRMRVLLAHLLKSQVAPGIQTGSWRATILEQRSRLEQLLSDSPSLRSALPAVVADVYPRAVELASTEMQLPAETFPRQCPYTQEQILSNFFPADQK